MSVGAERANASFDPEVASLRTAPFELLGEGVFGVTIDQGQDMQPYQGGPVKPGGGGPSQIKVAASAIVQS